MTYKYMTVISFWYEILNCVSLAVQFQQKKNKRQIRVINDPLDHTHSLASSEHCLHLKFVLFEKWGRTDGRCVQKQ